MVVQSCQTPTILPTPSPSDCNSNSCPTNLKSFSIQSLEISNETKEINDKLKSLGIKNSNTFKTQGFIGDVLTDFTSRIESAYQGLQLESLINDYKQNINNANNIAENISNLDKSLTNMYNDLDNLNNLLDKVDPHKKPNVFDNLVQSKSNLLMEINAKENNLDNLLLNLEQTLNTISNIEQAINQLIDSLSSQPCQCIPVSILYQFKNTLDEYKDKMLNKSVGKPWSNLGITKDVYNKIKNLIDKIDENVYDIIKSRGGKGGNVKFLGDSPDGIPYRNMTLREVAERASKGESGAETALKIIKQAAEKGQNN